MAMLPVSAATEVAACRFFSDLLSRARGLARTWSEEWDRAHAAACRYEELRIGHATDLSFRDRGSRARQVFLEMYAGK